jgi:hypothetical protein
MLAITLSFQPLSSLIEFTPAPIATGLTVTVRESRTYGGPDTFGFIGTNPNERASKASFSRYSHQNWIRWHLLKRASTVKRRADGNPRRVDSARDRPKGRCQSSGTQMR